METINAIGPKPIKGPVDLSASNVSTSGSDPQRDPYKDIISRNEKIHQSTEEVNKSKSAKLNQIAEAMDKYVQSVQRNLKIQVHGGTGTIMVKVISESDGKVIREIPPKELLDLAAKIEDMTGALFNEKT